MFTREVPNDLTIAEPRRPGGHDGEVSDVELVQRARGGEHEAYTDLFSRYTPLVRSILLAHAPLSEVEDASQEVFISAWHRLKSLRDERAFGPWLAAIARNTATSFHRRQWRRIKHLRQFFRASDPRPRIPGSAAEILEEIRALPEAYRETLLMRLVERMSGDQIAARTGLTPGSVRVNLHRGMKLLRERLENES